MKTYFFKTSLFISMLTVLLFTSILPQNKKSEAEGSLAGYFESTDEATKNYLQNKKNNRRAINCYYG